MALFHNIETQVAKGGVTRCNFSRSVGNVHLACTLKIAFPCQLVPYLLFYSALHQTSLLCLTPDDFTRQGRASSLESWKRESLWVGKLEKKASGLEIINQPSGLVNKC